MTEPEGGNPFRFFEGPAKQSDSRFKAGLGFSSPLTAGRSRRHTDSPVSRTKTFLTYFLTLVGISAWMTAILAAPFFHSRGSILGAFFYSLFAPICHQIPARSFFFLGQQLAVCGRCLGIYSGFFSGTLIYPLLKGWGNTDLPGRTLLIFMSLPIVFDTSGNMLRLWSSSNLVRLLLGLSWGAVLPYYFIPAIASVPWKRRIGLRPGLRQNRNSLS